MNGEKEEQDHERDQEKAQPSLQSQGSDLVPGEWAEMAEEEVTREILENVTNLRAAGL